MEENNVKDEMVAVESSEESVEESSGGEGLGYVILALAGVGVASIGKVAYDKALKPGAKKIKSLIGGYKQKKADDKAIEVEATVVENKTEETDK